MSPRSARGPRRLRRGPLLLLVLVVAVLAAGGTTLAVSAPSETPRPGPSDAGPRTVCGSPTPHPLGLTQRTLVHAGVPRSYAVHVPDAYDGSRPLPVVVLLHGLGRDPESMIAMTRMDRLADAEDVVVVAPRALGTVPAWRFSTAEGETGKDADFVDAVLDDVVATTCVDETRTYAVGFSNGGALAMALACRPTQRFAAYATVAGPWRSASCEQAPAASVIAFHGTQDRVVPYAGAKTRIGRLPGARSAAKAWARHDLCAPVQRPRPTRTVERLAWDDCREGSRVELWTVRGGRHAWPGGDRPGARTSTATPPPRPGTVDATRTIWEFLRDHRLGR